MKISLSRIQAAIALFAVLGGPVSCLGAQNLALEPNSTLALSGDSTLHPYTSTATVLGLAGAWDEVDSDIRKALLEKNALKEFRLTIPVKGLKSDESGLDKNMYKALKADEYPEIVFTLQHYRVIPSTPTPETDSILATGVLRIAGREQNIELTLAASRKDAGLRARGTHTLLMSDYGVKPPSLMLGAIKVRDPIVIHFDLHLR